METTNHIIIQVNNENGYPLFEEIQNKYSLYDNCVIDSNEKGETEQIVIEGKDLSQIMSLAQKILYEFVKELKIAIVPIEDTIIDDDRREETGGLEI